MIKSVVGMAALAACPLAPLAARPLPRPLPVAFEANHGQAHASVRFLAGSAAHTLYLTPTEAVLTLHGKADADTLRLELEGAKASAPISGVGRLPGVVNYLRGADPARWLPKIPTYERGRYSGVYDGIDLVFHGAEDGAFEYDFVVSPRGRS